MNLLLTLAVLLAATEPREHELRRALEVRGESLGCPPTFVSPPVTVYSAITTSTCVNTIDLRSEVFSVRVREGEILDVELSSPDFDVYLFMYLGGGRSGPDRRASWLWSGTSRVTMRYTAQETKTYELEAMHLFPLDWADPNTGRYTMRISIVGHTGCTAPTILRDPVIADSLLTPRLYATDPLTIEWFRTPSSTTFHGWPFRAPSGGTWSYRATNACGSTTDSVQVGAPSRRRSVSR